MAMETLMVLGAAFALFAAFGVAVGYANVIAGARAITPEEELALRAH